MILEINLLAEQVKELLESWRDLPVAEELLLRHLTGSLMKNAELEPRDQRVLVVPGYQSAGAGAHDRHQGAHVQGFVDSLRRTSSDVSMREGRIRVDTRASERARARALT